MGIRSKLDAARCNKSLIHLAMLTSIVAATLTTSSASAAGNKAPIIDNHRPAIPFCNGEEERTVGRRLLYVTTLDGRLSALDITKNGKLRWSIPTGPGPLISSSIHRLELTNNGQFVRMIPSLSGGIYKFDGESIDPIPITTENLLSSSAKFSDDLVISGGKETRTYGVSARTGQLLYECSMHGCINSTDPETTPATAGEHAEGNDNLVEHNPLVDDVIVVKRQTQTVRAVESRTGVERWNFSVGQHELDIVRSPDCHDLEFSDMDMAVLDLDLKVIVPEGLICAFSKSDPSVMLWKYKFEHPIVSSWKIGLSDELESIDMFSSAQWLWEQDDNMYDAPDPSISPSVYLGMYEKQLYIQESVSLRREIVDQSSNLHNHLTSGETILPKIPWRPVPANSNALVIVHDDKTISGGTLPPNHAEILAEGHELVPYDEDNVALAAQSVLNASEFVNGNGFYLYTRNDLNKTAETLCEREGKVPAIEAGNESHLNRTVSDDLGFSLDDIDAPVKVVILSLWFWWKEIVVIAITSAVVLNLLMGQRQHTEREIVVIERHIPVPTAMEATESSTAALLGPTNGSSKNNSNGFSLGYRTLSESTSHSGEHFSSRFQGDFDLMRCLGRGGFGVVFEAKNKLDDCKYAVKRITLPNKKESRERVMREVKTLANCEHQNIVRYFQAWVENPPPGWQEEEDNKWLAHEMSTSIQIETPDGTTLPSFASSLTSPGFQKKGSHLHNEKKKQLLSWVSSVNTNTACSKDYECQNGITDIAEGEDEDDSCIVFRTESQSLAMRDESENAAPKQQRKSDSDPIAIDIHSSSFELSAHQRNVDYSQLSDSFQIEFVRSMSGVHGDTNIWAEEEEAEKQKESQIKPKNGYHTRRPNSLELTIEHNNNTTHNSKALVPASSNSPPRTVGKPSQNKVYLYIQMQLCRKESLRDWLRENKTDARESHIASIFHQIVDAVEYVHLKGLIHRDLKPSNIFFSQDGQIKIGDFGLVTDMSDIPNLVTKCGDNSGLPSCARHTQQVGTHLYMSPEQLRGKHYDFKVDIYSLGLIFFELLVYFNTEMERIVTLRDLRDGRYPERFTVDYPKEYELLKLMLCPQPEQRPATVELKQQLANILKLPDMVGDSEATALLQAARRLSRSRTFSTNE